MAVLPQQVQRELEEAERIQRELANPTPPAPAAEDPAPAPQEDPPPADPDPAPPEPAPAVSTAEPAKGEDYWQQRFKTVEGINRQLSETLKQQSTALQQLSSQVESLRQQPATPPKPEEPLVTTRDEATFGADLVDMARRAAREESRVVSKRLEQIEGFIKQLTPKMHQVEQVKAEVAQTREDRFYSELTIAVPDWEAVNADPRWLKWLTEYDPVAGCTRQESLNAAQAALDHRRTGGLFKLFKASVMPAQPSQATKSKAELARQVAPNRSSTVTVQPQPAVTYSGADYLYWLDPRRLHDTDRTVLAAKKAELEQAFGEGRIQF